jgi:riboflavin synthase
MFTGIIEATGEIAALQRQGSDARIYVRTGTLDLGDVALGDSIAVNGVCLTAVNLPGDGFYADVSAETLARTTLGDLHSGSRVNLEKALTLQTRLGGHLVSGHVDGIGVLRSRTIDGHSQRLEIEAPAELAKYIAAKGSICVDGISLTVNSVTGAHFSLNIVPHTLAMTTLQAARVGARFNLEVDLIARYLERLLSADAQVTDKGVSKALLAEYGFLRQRG